MNESLRKIVGTWGNILSPILGDSQVMIDLDFIMKEYEQQNKYLIYPDKTNIFRAFKECDYGNLKVVILLQDPYTDGSATGIALGNEEKSTLISPSLKIVRQTICNKVYFENSFNSFDKSLLSWEKQGILLLNSALTVVKNSPGSHLLYWNRFTKLLLYKLSVSNPNLIFCLWGSIAREFEDIILRGNNQAIILKSSHPASALYNNNKWNCDHFNVINAKLAKYNTKINW